MRTVYSSNAGPAPTSALPSPSLSGYSSREALPLDASSQSPWGNTALAPVLMLMMVTLARCQAELSPLPLWPMRRLCGCPTSWQLKKKVSSCGGGRGAVGSRGLTEEGQGG